jgi:hypothetical protein
MIASGGFDNISENSESSHLRNIRIAISLGLRNDGGRY